MGNTVSQGSPATNFTGAEISRLSKRFKKLDTDQSGTVSLKEVMELPELKRNPLTKRIMEVFDADSSGEVDFTEFISGMSSFSSQADMESKLRFAFKIYDMDNDGFISNGELYQILRTMVGNNLKESQLQQIVDKTMRSVDADEDGKISFEEFCDIVYKREGDKKVEALTASIAQTI